MESERKGKEEEKYKEKKTGVREKDKRRTERSLCKTFEMKRTISKSEQIQPTSRPVSERR